ncbi:MAG: 7TM diverse intracellular signaling domain-containing protein [Ketobacteraceae bacterium]|nr:7TM diverse intracellular signaling domain-containing protein [Ketobacteraceae bacterium]
MIRLLILLLVTLSSSYTRAEPPSQQAGQRVIGQPGESILLGPYFSILEDPLGDLTITDLLSNPSRYPFRPVRSPVSQLGDRKSTFWLKLNYHINPQHHWMVTIEYPHLRSIRAYLQTGNDYLNIANTGYQAITRLSGPDVQGFGFQIPASDRSDSGTLYLRIASDSPLIVPAYLHTAETLLSHEKRGDRIRGFFYGIFFVMAAFNLFIYFTARNDSYIYYVLYITSILLFTLSNDGVVRQFLADHFNITMHYGAHMLTAIAPIVFGATFCQHFLYTRKTLPLFHQLFNTVILISLVIAFIIIAFGSGVFPRAVMILTLLFAFIAMAAGVAGLRNGNPTARFFCIAWAAVIIGSLTWIFILLDLLPYNQISRFSLHFGAAVETILLSMALGHRIRILEQERLAIEQRAKEQLEDSNRKLAASNKFKDEFLSVISHELRTPMNGIFGATELLKLANPNEEQQGYIDTVAHSSNEMLKMVEDILTYTQCEAGSLKENRADFDFRDMLGSLVNDYRQRCKHKGIRFEFHLSEEIPQKLHGDKSKLRLVLQHLLDNAWKFTDEGEVVFRCLPLSQNRDQIRIRFQVADTGCGVPDSMRDTIFESFRQADGSLTRKKGGLGIGLALSKDIIEILEGRLDFQSAPGRGTTVTVDLDFAKADPLSGSIHDTRSAALPLLKPGKKVLIVEDNPVNKLVLESLIRKLGLLPESAIHGQEALEFLQEKSVDIILMDCQMPIMDGFEATRRIRELNNSNQNIPIIAVTANANPGDRLKCLEAGMNDYIKKPISQNILIDKLSNWLSH